eukprot:1155450-Pelagomonas_calceolata.AAC.1
MLPAKHCSVAQGGGGHPGHKSSRGAQTRATEHIARAATDVEEKDRHPRNGGMGQAIGGWQHQDWGWPMLLARTRLILPLCCSKILECVRRREHTRRVHNADMYDAYTTHTFSQCVYITRAHTTLAGHAGTPSSLGTQMQTLLAILANNRRHS